MGQWVTKDSGERETFDTGARRDVREGKGRYDLLQPCVIRRLAGVLERGAAKYEARNYEKGQPQSRCMDSALRHLFQHLDGKRDEDHLAQCMWNIAAMIFQEEMVERGILPAELLDLPDYSPRVEPADRPFAETLSKDQKARVKKVYNDIYHKLTYG